MAITHFQSTAAGVDFSVPPVTLRSRTGRTTGNNPAQDITFIMGNSGAISYQGLAVQEITPPFDFELSGIT